MADKASINCFFVVEHVCCKHEDGYYLHVTVGDGFIKFSNGPFETKDECVALMDQSMKQLHEAGGIPGTLH